MNKTRIDKACIDWCFNDDSNGRYKFIVPRAEHDLTVGDKVTVRMLVWNEEQTATIEDVHDDGIVVKTDWIDISEEYKIEKI